MKNKNIYTVALENEINSSMSNVFLLPPIRNRVKY